MLQLYKNIKARRTELKMSQDTFLSDALDAYRLKYGTYTSVGNYVIVFEPNLTVIQKA